MENKFKFDRNRKRVEFCPCGKSNKDGKFSPFIGAIHYGMCHSCGQIFRPAPGLQTNKPIKQFKPKPPSYIESDVFKKSLSSYHKNAFIDYLMLHFNKETVVRLIEKYHIGTSKHWNGATVFWQMDINGRVRTGKVMLYDQKTGRRVKEPYSHINWAHVLNEKGCAPKEFVLKQCFFGEHLLRSTAHCEERTWECSAAQTEECTGVRSTAHSEERSWEHSAAQTEVRSWERSVTQTEECTGKRSTAHTELRTWVRSDKENTVAIVESEATAIYCAGRMPQIIWLATGGSNGCNMQKQDVNHVLRSRNVILFPDLGQFDKWSAKAVEMRKNGLIVSVSALLEEKAPQSHKNKGNFDLRDYLDAQ